MAPEKVRHRPARRAGATRAPRQPETVRPDSSWPKDVRAALARAAELRGSGGQPFLDPAAPVHVARAPGRIDLMGGIGDYSGSTVLEWPIDTAAVALAQAVPDTAVVVRTVEPWIRGVAEADDEVRVDLAVLEPFADYEEFRSRLPSGKGARWAAYVLGAFAVLMREQGVRFARGTRVLVDSQVPAGKGLASSAAVEVAALLAVAGAHGIRLKPGEVPALAQLVENKVVGVPCGIMDQITAYHGVSGSVLPIHCQPGEARPPIPLPPGVEVVGIDTGIRHDVGGAAYRVVRTGAAIGYRMIADLLHLGIKPVGSDHVKIHDPVLGGYLANLGPSQFERKFAHRLPDRISGKNFMDCFGGIVDREITVDPRQEYAVRAATAFPVYEHLRAITFAGLLSQGGGAGGRDALWAMGELMLATHDGYNRAGLGDASADELVELALAEGPEQGIYGAKTSGGGSGGTVVLLLDRRGRPALERIAAQYGKRTGKQPLLVRGTSEGARDFGVRAVLLQA